MKNNLLSALFLLLPAAFLHAQAISINTDGSSPDPSAILDVKSTDKGILVPRMTTAQRAAIATPAAGLLVFDTTTGSFWFYNGAAWTDLSAVKKIADADGDTRIQVEESPDEDILRVDLAGSERLVLRQNTGGGTLVELPNNLNNTFLGTGTGNGNTTGFSNTAQGFQALYANTSGPANVANGSKALFSNTSGSSNTASGMNALYSNTTGYYNTASGRDALYSNTTGSANTATGVDAQYYNTTGFSNTAVGAAALYRNTTRSNLVAVGDSALYNNGVGATYSYEAAYNTAIGSKALYSNTTGYQNTANGYQALYVNTTGNQNTALGFGADVSSGDLWNATAVGANALAGASNTLVLGSVDGVNGATSSVKVGIGTATPAAKLHVENGAVLFAGIYGGTPLAGEGTRLMWIPAKEAFRAGSVLSTQWDDANIGLGSFVGGGYSNTASNYRSFVGGGLFNNATGFDSFVGGGRNNYATETYSFVGGGENNSAKGWRSFVGGGGSFNVAWGSNSFVGGGVDLKAMSFGEAVFGTYNTKYTPLSTDDFNPADRLFVLGNGTSDINRSNAVTVLKNGNTGIGRIPATNRLEVEGEASKSSAGSWLANSDARLKKNITPLNSHEMLDKLLALQGITYEWNDDKTGSRRPEGIQYGFTAQNIQQVFPTLVEEDKLGYLQTAYGTYDAMTVEAIRALHDKIEALKVENATQKTQLDTQAALLQKITAALQTAGIGVRN